jgi:hypothetical protein
VKRVRALDARGNGMGDSPGTFARRNARGRPNFPDLARLVYGALADPIA